MAGKAIKANPDMPVAKASVTYVRMSPSKVHIVLDLIRNKPAAQAKAILKHTPRAACEPVLKLLNSAMANAENNFDMDPERLYVSACWAGHGPTLKRMRFRGRGGTTRILKKTAHINIELMEAE